ncbi:hypothetical protein [Nocardioides nitrophenolicus]|uniref:hypothetical protein n=1 Tax=Nocardioides nitrophenolicus TaxID=60489 RepID=UPI001958AE39|nr:hypothetical protein [Nocardioides nitrophenolicus]MBM7516470.1 hypothetical protein [Nocardioides nitrophenolicus]
MSAEGRAALAAVAPATAAALAEVERVAATTADAATRELVARRVAGLLGLPAPAGGALPDTWVCELDEWHASTLFDEATRGLLAFVDQFVFAVGSMGDDEVAALLATRSPREVHELCNVVWSIDLALRADHVAARVLA